MSRVLAVQQVTADVTVGVMLCEMLFISWSFWKECGCHKKRKEQVKWPLGSVQTNKPISHDIAVTDPTTIPTQTGILLVDSYSRYLVLLRYTDV